MTLTLRYCVIFGRGDSSDWLDYDAYIPDELTPEMRKAAMSGIDPENVDCLKEILSDEKKEMEDMELDNLREFDDYVRESLENGENPFEHGYVFMVGGIFWSDFDFSDEDIEGMFKEMALNPKNYSNEDIQNFIDNFESSYKGKKNFNLLLDSLIDSEIMVEYEITVERPWYCTDPEVWQVGISRDEAKRINSLIIDEMSLNEASELSGILDRAKKEIIDSGILENLDFDVGDDFDPENYYTVDVRFIEED